MPHILLLAVVSVVFHFSEGDIFAATITIFKKKLIKCPHIFFKACDFLPTKLSLKLVTTLSRND